MGYAKQKPFIWLQKLQSKGWYLGKKSLSLT